MKRFKMKGYNINKDPRLSQYGGNPPGGLQLPPGPPAAGTHVVDIKAAECTDYFVALCDIAREFGESDTFDNIVYGSPARRKEWERTMKKHAARKFGEAENVVYGTPERRQEWAATMKRHAGEKKELPGWVVPAAVAGGSLGGFLIARKAVPYEWGAALTGAKKKGDAIEAKLEKIIEKRNAAWDKVEVDPRAANKFNPDYREAMRDRVLRYESQKAQKAIDRHDDIADAAGNIAGGAAGGALAGIPAAVIVARSRRENR